MPAVFRALGTLAGSVSRTALSYARFTPRIDADKFWRDLDDTETTARKARAAGYDFDFSNPPVAHTVSGKVKSFELYEEPAKGLSWRFGYPPADRDAYQMPAKTSLKLHIVFRPVTIDGKQELIYVGLTDETGSVIPEWSADGDYEQLTINFPVV